MESRKIFIQVDRMTDGWINRVEEQEPDNTIVKYHRALEAAESQIEKLESEKRELEERIKKLVASVRDYDIDLFETSEERDKIQEENTRLKELIVKAFEEGAGTGCYYETDDEEFIKEQCQEWLKSHNIEYTKQ